MPRHVRQHLRRGLAALELEPQSAQALQARVDLPLGDQLELVLGEQRHKRLDLGSRRHLQRCRHRPVDSDVR